MSCANKLIGAEVTRVIVVHDHRHFFLSNGYTLTFPSWVEISGRSSNFDDLEGCTIEKLGTRKTSAGTDLFEMVLTDGLIVSISFQPPAKSEWVQTLSVIDPNDRRLVWKDEDFFPSP